MTLKPGQLVQLNTLRPELVVENVLDNERVLCSWVDHNGLRRYHEFPAMCLVAKQECV